MPDKASEKVDVSTSIQNKKPPGGDPGGKGGYYEKLMEVIFSFLILRYL